MRAGDIFEFFVVVSHVDLQQNVRRLILPIHRQQAIQLPDESMAYAIFTGRTPAAEPDCAAHFDMRESVVQTRQHG